MTPRRRHARPLRSAPRALPTPTLLGNLIVRHAGPLSISLLNRNVSTGGQVTVLSQAIVDGNNALSREVALKLAQLDPGNPDAIQLVHLLGARPSRDMN